MVVIKIANKKNERLKSTISALLGISLLISFFALTVFWELQGRKMVQYSEVLAASVDIQRGEVIGASMLKVVLLDNDTALENTIRDPHIVIGKAAKQYIPKNSAIHELFIEDSNLITSEDQLITRIPNEWIYSIPSTIRRLDTAVFYALSTEEQLKNSAVFQSEKLPRIKDLNEEKIINEISEGVNEQYVEDTLEKYDGKGLIILDELNKDIKEEPVFKTTVAFVRDSRNKEVKTVSYIDRLDGSSNVASLEVVITEEEFRHLENKIIKGYKFAIMYY